MLPYTLRNQPTPGAKRTLPPICAPVRSVGLAARAAPNSYSVALCPPGSADARRRRPPCPMRSPDLTDPTSAHLRSAGSSRP